MRQRGCAFFDTASLFLHMSHYRKFEIPDSWEWVKIEDIGEVITGNTPPKDNQAYYGGDIPFYKPTDLDQGIKTSCASDSLSIEGYNISRKLPVSSILVTCIGATIGKTGLILTEGSCNQQINAVITGACILPKFLFYTCVSEYFQNEIKENASATTLPILNKNNFSVLFIPLPPKEEQERIVDEIERLLTKVERIELNCGQLEESLSLTKSKILELAMQGKLVPQDPSEEPAADMLRRVNPKARIITDNPHYPQLPDNWVISSIGDIFAINPKNIAKDSTLAGFVPMASIEDGYSDSFEYTPKEWGEIKNGFTHFADGDIAVAKISPCLENRKSMILRGLPNGIGSGTTELLVFRSKVIYPPYGLLFFKSSSFISKCVGTFNGVVGQQRVNKTIVGAMPIPIPPYNEQKQIVEKVNQLFIFLDAMQSNLSD